MALLFVLHKKLHRLFWSGAICEKENVFVSHFAANVLQISSCVHLWWVTCNYRYCGFFPYRHDLLLSVAWLRWKLVKILMLLLVDIHVTLVCNIWRKFVLKMLLSSEFRFRRLRIDLNLELIDQRSIRHLIMLKTTNDSIDNDSNREVVTMYINAISYKKKKCDTNLLAEVF